MPNRQLSIDDYDLLKELRQKKDRLTQEYNHLSKSGDTDSQFVKNLKNIIDDVDERIASLEDRDVPLTPSHKGHLTGSETLDVPQDVDKDVVTPEFARVDSVKDVSKDKDIASQEVQTKKAKADVLDPIEAKRIKGDSSEPDMEGEEETKRDKRVKTKKEKPVKPKIRKGEVEVLPTKYPSLRVKDSFAAADRAEEKPESAPPEPEEKTIPSDPLHIKGYAKLNNQEIRSFCLDQGITIDKLKEIRNKVGDIELTDREEKIDDAFLGVVKAKTKAILDKKEKDKDLSPEEDDQVDELSKEKAKQADLFSAMQTAKKVKRIPKEIQKLDIPAWRKLLVNYEVEDLDKYIEIEQERFNFWESAAQDEDLDAETREDYEKARDTAHDLAEMAMAIKDKIDKISDEEFLYKQEYEKHLKKLSPKYTEKHIEKALAPLKNEIDVEIANILVSIIEDVARLGPSAWYIPPEDREDSAYAHDLATPLFDLIRLKQKESGAANKITFQPNYDLFKRTNRKNFKNIAEIEMLAGKPVSKQYIDMMADRAAAEKAEYEKSQDKSIEDKPVPAGETKEDILNWFNELDRDSKLLALEDPDNLKDLVKAGILDRAGNLKVAIEPEEELTIPESAPPEEEFVSSITPEEQAYLDSLDDISAESALPEEEVLAEPIPEAEPVPEEEIETYGWEDFKINYARNIENKKGYDPGHKYPRVGDVEEYMSKELPMQWKIASWDLLRSGKGKISDEDHAEIFMYLTELGGNIVSNLFYHLTIGTDIEKKLLLQDSQEYEIGESDVEDLPEGEGYIIKKRQDEVKTQNINKMKSFIADSPIFQDFYNNTTPNIRLNELGGLKDKYTRVSDIHWSEDEASKEFVEKEVEKLSDHNLQKLMMDLHSTQLTDDPKEIEEINRVWEPDLNETDRNGIISHLIVYPDMPRLTTAIKRAKEIAPYRDYMLDIKYELFGVIDAVGKKLGYNGKSINNVKNHWDKFFDAADKSVFKGTRSTKLIDKEFKNFVTTNINKANIIDTLTGEKNFCITGYKGKQIYSADLLTKILKFVDSKVNTMLINVNEYRMDVNEVEECRNYLHNSGLKNLSEFIYLSKNSIV